MGRPIKGDLSSHVTRVMKFKGLSPREVAERSGNKITAAYVSSLMNGVADNPSVRLLNALAKGLGEDPAQLFAIASGLNDSVPDHVDEIDPSHTLMILDLMKQVAVSPELIEIVQEVVDLWPSERPVMLRTIRALNEEKPRSTRRKNAM